MENKKLNLSRVPSRSMNGNESVLNSPENEKYIAVVKT